MFFVVRGNFMPKLHPTFGPCPWWFIFFPKTTPCSWCFLLITVACIGFWKKVTKWYNLTNFCIINNMFHHKYEDKSFSGVIKKLVSLRDKFPCFPARWVSMRDEPVKLNPTFYKCPNLLKISHPISLPIFGHPTFR